MRIILHNEIRTRLPSLSLTRLAGTAGALLRLPGNAEVAVFVVTDRTMRSVNAWTRRQHRTTDVLSFPLHARRPFAPDPDGTVRLGDVLISLSTARRQAKTQGISVRDELRELLVHGILHLAGFDHTRPREAARMAAAAEKVLTPSLRRRA